LKGSFIDLGYKEDDFLLIVGKCLFMKISFSVMNTLKDSDNLLKFVLDALQTVVYSNDKLLYEIHVRKVWFPLTAWPRKTR
jgi:hypothetical protein